MFKILPLMAIIFSGCSNFTLNATICDQISSDAMATIPKECQNYSEEKAQKAFDKLKDKHESQDDIIKFSKDADDKQN